MFINKSVIDVIKRVSKTVYLYASKVSDYEIVDYIGENILSGGGSEMTDQSGSKFVDWLVSEELLTGLESDPENIFYESDYTLSDMTIGDVLLFFAESNESGTVSIDYSNLIDEVYGSRILNGNGEREYTGDEKILDEDDFLMALLFVTYASSQPSLVKALENVCTEILSIKDHIFESEKYVDAKNYIIYVEDLFGNLNETVILLSQSACFGQ